MLPARLKFQPTMARALGQRRDAPMVNVATTIEDDLCDASRLRALRHQLADEPGLADAAVLLEALERLRRILAIQRGDLVARHLGELGVARGGREQRPLRRVVDELRVDLVAAAEDGEAWP